MTGRLAIDFALGGDCPNNASAPSGYSIWRGPVPAELTQWAIALRDRLAPFPYGQQWSTLWNGATIVARKDHHTWTYRKNSNGSATLAQNICIPGITIYRPISTGVTGLADDYVYDPATAQPDPQLALYGASEKKSFWLPVIVGVAAGAAAVAAFYTRKVRRVIHHR